MPAHDCVDLEALLIPVVIQAVAEPGVRREEYTQVTHDEALEEKAKCLHVTQ